MTTTIINPAPNNDSANNGVGFLLGVVLLVVLGLLFFVYVFPYIRGMGSNGVQINVPKSIDVNVQQSK